MQAVRLGLVTYVPGALLFFKKLLLRGIPPGKASAGMERWM